MTIPETLAFVRRYQRWRRGDEQYGESIEMPHPKMIGEALDALCDEVERLSVAKCPACGHSVSKGEGEA